MPTITTPEGNRIRYEEWGEGTPFVLAHGFGVSLEMWAWQQPHLAQGRRLILWDARGHGGSSAPAAPEGYTMQGLASDLRALLEQIDAVEGAVVGGMSFGGQIALQYAVEHRADVAALVLSDTGTRSSEPELEAGPPPAWFRYNPGMSGAWRAMHSRPNLTPLLPSLTMPALVLYGEHDEFVRGGVERLIAGLPNRRIVRFRGCVHGTSAQRPQEWTAAVMRFLGDVEAGRPVAGEETI